MFVLESIVQFVMEYALKLVLKFVLKLVLEKFVLLKIIFKKKSQNLRQAHVLEVGLIKILGDHGTLSIVGHVELHVDFSSRKSSLGI